jgi:hypothetical protein
MNGFINRSATAGNRCHASLGSSSPEGEKHCRAKAGMDLVTNGVKIKTWAIED